MHTNKSIRMHGDIMRLVTYSRLGVPSIGLDLESGILDIPEAASFFGRKYHVHGHNFPRRMMDLLTWDAGFDVVSQILSRYQNAPVDERPMIHNREDIKIEAPINRPGKIIGLGLNYSDHAKETGSDVPRFPVIFAKFPSSVVGPGTSISIPSVTKKLDWEVELGIVIGKICKDVSKSTALDYVAGYTVINDLSARDLQKDGDGQWIQGKSLDGLCPMGPCIVTTDELKDGSGLKMYTKVNDVVKQDSTTSNLIVGVAKIVAHLSERFTLEPGDVIATGTPSGVGFARDPPEFLKPGDEVEVFIEGIGPLKNKIM
ncbi:MAG: fumarylacetoacetate hydrolase family protein, partial [Candidatus Thorarchaeota archaeon]